MLEKIRLYISPYFLVRHYLRQDIRYLAKKYKFEGKTLDVGCGQKPYKSLFSHSEYLGIDFKEYSKNRDFPEDKPDFYFDDKYSKDFLLPFEKEIFGNVVSFQVLEHHKKPELMISEMARVVKNGGLILLSCPFIYALHEEPNDFQRLTEYKLAEIFKKNNCEIIEIRRQGSLFSAISVLINEYLSNFAAGGGIRYLGAAAVYLPFLFFQYSSLMLDILVKSDKIFINYIILAKKHEER